MARPITCQLYPLWRNAISSDFLSSFSVSEIEYFVCKRADVTSVRGEILLFFFFHFFLLLSLFSKDEKDCKTDSVREKKKLFKDLKEGANSAGLYLHNIL